jgi:hypothetical protein
MIEPQRFPQLEAVEDRIARFDRAIELWRREGYAYVTLTPKGNAQPHHAGTLARLLQALARHPGAQLLELASPTFRNDLMRWALTPRPVAIDPKGSN